MTIISAIVHVSGGDIINKQKFLAELAKLLTFMYEEDRQLALQLYGDMFDEAGDEQLFIQHLVSPTRQAVIVARAYNSKERKLQIHSGSREDGSDDFNPDFVDAINAVMDDFNEKYPVIYPEAEQTEEPAGDDMVDENQISLFDEMFPEDTFPAEQGEEEALPYDAENTSSSETDMYSALESSFAGNVPEEEPYDPVSAESQSGEDYSAFPDDAAAVAESAEAPEEAVPVCDPAVAGIMASVFDSFDKPADDPVPEEGDIYDASEENEAVAVPEAEYGENLEEAYMPEGEDAAPAAEAYEAYDEEAAETAAEAAEYPLFISGAGDDAVAAGDETRETAEEALPDDAFLQDDTDAGIESLYQDSVEIYLPDEEEIEPQRKAIVPLLVLYILIAVPITLLGVAVLLVPTLLSLMISVSSVVAGIAVVTVALGALNIFADIIFVIGIALIAFAVGFLFLWLFIWFIGGAIVGFVKGVFGLGRKLCYKEVA